MNAGKYIFDKKSYWDKTAETQILDFWNHKNAFYKISHRKLLI